MEWKRVSLDEEKSKSPNQLEMAVFNDSVSNLTGLQKKLDTDYHNDRYLRDLLLTEIDIPSIHDHLMERIPRTAQQAIQRTVLRLSEKTKNAGSITEHIATLEVDT